MPRVRLSAEPRPPRHGQTRALPRRLTRRTGPAPPCGRVPRVPTAYRLPRCTSQGRRDSQQTPSCNRAGVRGPPSRRLRGRRSRLLGPLLRGLRPVHDGWPAPPQGVTRGPHVGQGPVAKAQRACPPRSPLIPLSLLADPSGLPSCAPATSVQAPHKPQDSRSGRRAPLRLAHRRAGHGRAGPSPAALTHRADAHGMRTARRPLRRGDRRRRVGLTSGGVPRCT